MADRSVKLTLTANVQGLVASMRTAQNAVKDFGDKATKGIERHRDTINAVSNATGALGLATVGLVSTAVKRFADFDAAMSSVQAATRASADDMDLLRQAALDAGQETVYSATESAAAIENLAKAGVSTTDILGGGLHGALNLAAADGMDVAAAAEIAASALTQFNLEGSQAGHVADLLAAGAGKAQGGVQDMGMALGQAGLVANQFGLSIEETVGGLTAFASAGLVGSDAGTSMRSMLLHLANPAKETAGLMEELGIHAYDAAGNFVGLESLAGQLQDRLGHLTQAQRDQALAQIFGSDAVRAANVLYQQGAAGIADWTAQVDDSGFAAEQAALRLDNLKGDIEQLGGALETAMIGAGEGANGPLRSLVQSATDAVNAFSDLPPAVQQSVLLIAGGGGLALLGVAAMGKLTVATIDTVSRMRDLGLVSERTAGRMDRVTRAGAKVAGLAVGLWAVAQGFDAIASSSDKAAVGVEQTESALRGIEGLSLDGLFADLGTDFEDMAGAAELLFGGGVNGKMERFGSTLNGIFFGGQLSDQVKDARDQFENMGLALAQMVQAGDADAAAEQFDAIAQALQAEGLSMEQVNSLMPAYAESLAAMRNEGETAAAATQGVADAMGAMPEASEQAAAAVEDWRDRVGEAFGSFIDPGGAFQAAIDKNRQFAEETAAATESSEDSWEDFYDGHSVSTGDFIGQLEAQVRAQESWATNMTALSSRVNKNMTGDMRDAANEMIDELMELGPEGAAAVQTLHDMSDDELAKVVSLYQRKGRTSGDKFADQIAATRPPAIPVDANTGPARAKGAALVSYLSSLRATVGVGAETSAAQMAVNAFINRNSGRTIMVGTTSVQARAAGGWVFGPGTSTSDSIPARLSNGEFVVNAYAAQRNAALLEAINSGRQYAQGLAAGGWAGSGPAVATTGSGDATRDDLTLIAEMIASRPLILRVGQRELAVAVQDSAQFLSRRGGS